jgi:hypothetical protein
MAQKIDRTIDRRKDAGDVFEFALYRIVLGVTALTPSASIHCKDSEVLSE